MEKQYNVFIQWNENTSNYKRFDGGLEQIGEPHPTVGFANRAAAERLFWDGDFNPFYYYYPYALKDIHDRGTGLQLGKDDTNVVIDFNSTEPASVDFGDGTIYVAEVVE